MLSWDGLFRSICIGVYRKSVMEVVFFFLHLRVARCDQLIRKSRGTKFNESCGFCSSHHSIETSAKLYFVRILQISALLFCDFWNGNVAIVRNWLLVITKRETNGDGVLTEENQWCRVCVSGTCVNKCWVENKPNKVHMWSAWRVLLQWESESESVWRCLGNPST